MIDKEDKDYFIFEKDTIDLYNNNIINFEENIASINDVLINNKFYENISLENINTLKEILSNMKQLNIKSLNYDFIKKELIID